MANLHHIMPEAQFQKWRVTYASAIPDDMHVKLVESSANNAPCVDANDLDARILTFRPFYFSLGFTFPMSKFFREVFYAMECAPSHCTPNQFDNFSQRDHVRHDDVLEVSARWEGDVGNGQLVQITSCDGTPYCCFNLLPFYLNFLKCDRLTSVFYLQ
ncbi:unnamed protein product [Prunus brigantina]